MTVSEGPPINGALLGPGYVWWKSIVFSGVRPVRLSSAYSNSAIQVVTFGGMLAFIILRVLLWRKKDDAARWIV